MVLSYPLFLFLAFDAKKKQAKKLKIFKRNWLLAHQTNYLYLSTSGIMLRTVLILGDTQKKLPLVRMCRERNFNWITIDIDNGLGRANTKVFLMLGGVFWQERKKKKQIICKILNTILKGIRTRLEYGIGCFCITAEKKNKNLNGEEILVHPKVESVKILNFPRDA